LAFNNFIFLSTFFRVVDIPYLILNSYHSNELQQSRHFLAEGEKWVHLEFELDKVKPSIEIFSREFNASIHLNFPQWRLVLLIRKDIVT